MSRSCNDETRRVIDAVIRWLELRAEHEKDEGRGIPQALRDVNFTQLRADAWHSALLERLLDGKEPLPLPPPHAYSYPWYSLIETGHAETAEIWFPEPGTRHLPADAAVVCQNAEWRLLERISEEEVVLLWPGDGSRWRCRRSPHPQAPDILWWSLDREPDG